VSIITEPIADGVGILDVAELAISGDVDKLGEARVVLCKVLAGGACWLSKSRECALRS
jgi:hypothetical protein